MALFFRKKKTNEPNQRRQGKVLDAWPAMAILSSTIMGCWEVGSMGLRKSAGLNQQPCEQREFPLSTVGQYLEFSGDNTCYVYIRMYIYIYIYMCVYIYIHVCIYIYRNRMYRMFLVILGKHTRTKQIGLHFVLFVFSWP